ncbi:MAG: stress response translation initiation inhibitor YciH [Candidatus Micrarchaeia archaeon]
MPDICPKCGLPQDICACEALEREETQRVKVYTTKKKFGKLVTVVEGIDKHDIDKITKELKRKLACGGTVKEGMVILQGDHKEKMKSLLVAMGYPEERISVI